MRKKKKGKKKLHIAWSGDSRAVLAKNGKVSYATKDHKPFGDKSRIEKAGYPVVAWKHKKDDDLFWTIPSATKQRWDEVIRERKIVQHKGDGYKYYLVDDQFKEVLWRTFGYISVSRSIGDKYLKDKFPGMVVVDPEVKANINLTKKHNFLILACDGVWDVIDNDEAVRIVNNALTEEKEYLSKDPKGVLEKGEEDGNDVTVQYAARALRDAAYKKGSTDNISVIVVRFVHSKD